MVYIRVFKSDEKQNPILVGDGCFTDFQVESDIYDIQCAFDLVRPDETTGEAESCVGLASTVACCK